jgi:hypothetical protein
MISTIAAARTTVARMMKRSLSDDLERLELMVGLYFVRERARAVPALPHPYAQIAARAEHASPSSSVSRPHMPASGTDALGTRIAFAWSFGVSHLPGGWVHFHDRISARHVKGGNLRALWDAFINASLREWVVGIVVGVIVGVVIAVILDLLAGDSKIRGLMRFVKNKISEQSVARLKKRIEELEKYKKNLDLMLNSDKALYLNTFRAIFGTLLFGCIGAILTILRHSEMLAMVRPESPGTLAILDLAAIMMFAIGFTVALGSVTVTIAEDNKEKFAAQSEKYGKEIEQLKMILKTRLDKLDPHP